MILHSLYILKENGRVCKRHAGVLCPCPDAPSPWGLALDSALIRIRSYRVGPCTILDSAEVRPLRPFWPNHPKLDNPLVVCYFAALPTA